MGGEDRWIEGRWVEGCTSRPSPHCMLLPPLHALCSHPGPTPPEDPRNSHLYQMQRTLFPLLLPPSLTTLPPVYHLLTHDCTIILHTQQAVCITVLCCLKRWEGLILQRQGLTPTQGPSLVHDCSTVWRIK